MYLTFSLKTKPLLRQTVSMHELQSVIRASIPEVELRMCHEIALN